MKNIIDFDAVQEQWKKDRLIVAVFDVMAEIGETKPFINEMIKERSVQIFAKLKEAVSKTIPENQVLLSAVDNDEDYEYKIGQLIHNEFRNLTDAEQEILFCSLDFQDLKEGMPWYEWEILTNYARPA